MNKGMTEKLSGELLRAEGEKIEDVIYYMENEFYGQATELYGGKKPSLSPEQAARQLAEHGYNIQHGGKTYKRRGYAQKDKIELCVDGKEFRAKQNSSENHPGPPSHGTTPLVGVATL